VHGSPEIDASRDQGKMCGVNSDTPGLDEPGKQTKKARSVNSGNRPSNQHPERNGNVSGLTPETPAAC